MSVEPGSASMEVAPLGDVTNKSNARRVSLCDYIGTEKGQSSPVGKGKEVSTKKLSAKGQELLELVEELSYYGGEYALSSTCMTFLDSLIKGKKSVTLSPPLKMESAAHSRFMDAIENFQHETEDYEEAFKELEHAKKRVAEKEEKKDLASNTKPSGVNVASSQASGRDIFLEMKQSEEILLKLQAHQEKADKLIAEKKIKRDQAQIALKLSEEDAQKSKQAVLVGSSAAAAYKANVSTVEDRMFQTEIRRVSDQIDNAEALLAGLKVLSGISDLSVPKEPVMLQQQANEAGGDIKGMKVIPVTAQLGRLTCVFTLETPSLRLLSVEVVRIRCTTIVLGDT